MEWAGGEILQTDGIRSAYETGRGSITMRGHALIEEEGITPEPSRGLNKRSQKRAGTGRALIAITELPYQTNKADFVGHIAQLVDAGTLSGE